ncbi:MAG: amidohydrolase, partial [Planctomycetes bacterium]|nr:amidohydrolase [Planctomycetota bacterium]
MIALFLVLPLLAAAAAPSAEEAPDLILHHGKIVTVDPQFRIVEAMAVRGDRIVAVGASDPILRLAGPKT